LSIATKLVPGPVNETTVCTENPKQYQSWKIENWLRKIEMEAGSSPTDAELLSDSGPSFSLTNMANGDAFSCTPGEKQNGTFVGACESADGAGTTADFLFDPMLNMLEVSQHWECDDSYVKPPPFHFILTDIFGPHRSLDAVGVGYMQSSCERVFNTANEFTCTMLPVWVGTGTV
jgi:hypothetical protein